jgi:MoaA/NifB/PqqE/SkfB family radical SAM enzyme
MNNITSIKKQNNFSENSFCPEVYNQIQIDMQGDIRICCLSADNDSGITRDQYGNIMNVKTHSIIDAMNSYEHRQHRLELSNNIRPSRCNNCYKGEIHGFSRRMKFIKLSKNEILPEYVKAEDAYSITTDNGSIDTSITKLINLDIRFGNLCNLKCIMCDPGNSSLWYEDWDLLSKSFNDHNDSGRSLKFRHGGIDPLTGNAQYWKSKTKVYVIEKNKHGKLKLEGGENWWETDSWKLQFKNIAPQLRHIYFTGGEPLIVPAMGEHLNYLINNGFSKDIILCYDTNLTVINKNLIDQWKFFKNIELRISIDEVGDRYNIIRNPGNFDKIKENILVIKNAGIPISCITMVCGISNIYGSIRVSQFAKEIGETLSSRFVNRPNWLNVKNLPISAREEVIDTLSDFLKSSESSTISGYEHVINGSIKYLFSTLDTPGDLQMIESFVKVMNILDKSRGLDWKSVLCDVAGLINRHCPEIDLNLSS